MMLLTIGSYSGAFFGASDNPTRGLGMNHDMRPPSMGIMHNVPHQEMLKRGGVNGDNMNGAPSQSVENGQVVDWDKVPPHLRGYYSKVFGVQPGGGRSGQQQQQQQQQAGMSSPEMQRQADLAAAQAIQSIGNEAIGAENSIKVPELEQH